MRPTPVNLQKTKWTSPLKIPPFAGSRLPKMSRFVDDIFKCNEDQPELLVRDNVWQAARFFTYKCKPESMQSFLREFKRHEDVIELKCAEQQRAVKEREKKLDREQGAFDKPLKFPGVRNKATSWNDFTYERYANKMQNENLKAILTREQVHAALEHAVKVIYREPAHNLTRTETRFRADMRNEGNKYWARRAELDKEEEEEEE